MNILTQTSTQRYITGTTALNVPLAEEGHGDWHFIEAFYGRGSRPPKIFIAGEGEEWDTNFIFGNFGIYECSEKLRELGIKIPTGKKVYIAGHYRAVLDMLYRCVSNGNYPHHLDIDQWFDNENQKKFLISKIKEMQPYLTKEKWRLVEQWLLTIL
jgi:hypothetical protein